MNNYEEDGVLISQDAIENSMHKEDFRSVFSDSENSLTKTIILYITTLRGLSR